MGLVSISTITNLRFYTRFNPAKAEDGFKIYTNQLKLELKTFNPAAAEEGFRRLKQKFLTS